MDGVFGFFLLLAWLACGALGAYVAAEKRRELAEGVIMGLVFGPIGAVIVALLPAGDGRPRRARGGPAGRRAGSTSSSASASPLAALGLPADPPEVVTQGWTLSGPLDDGPAPDTLKGLRL